MLRLAFATVAALAVVGFGLSAGAADRLSSRSCAAIAFHPVAPGVANGEQEAGYYKSRLGRIEVRASIKNRVLQRYYVSLDGAVLAPVHGALPPLVAACAKAKRLAPPIHPDRSCLGDRLVVMIGDTGGHHYILLYARHGRAWHFCSAGRA
ncbi:MAG: hypothetical protein KGL11_07940 [Alphaproteobacteria bacterium]|nr:hypothetical protein [Alphaproteobacteria bacterium]